MNEDNKIATINSIKGLSADIITMQNAINQIIDEIKNKTNYTENDFGRAVPYYAIKDNMLLEVTDSYQNNYQLVKLSDISYSGTPDPSTDPTPDPSTDPTPPVQETYNYDIPIYINNIIIGDGINPNDITIKFIQNDKSIAEIYVPDTFIEFDNSKTTNKSISYTSQSFITNIIIYFTSATFKDNYNIMCSCNGISNSSTISGSGGGQTEIKLENVTLMNNEKGFKNTINISIGAVS